MRDIHHAESSLKKLIEKIENDNRITKENREAILNFYKYSLAKNLKPATIEKIFML